MRVHTDTTRHIATPALRETIRQQGRLTSWLSRQVGMSKSQMSNVIVGRRTISTEDAQRIADILGVPFFVLFVCSSGHTSVSRRPHAVEEVAS